METIINSLMEKYFVVLFKNFKKENLKVNLFEGLSSGQSNLTLNDLDFTEAVIQELLYVPPQLEVQSARVNSLRIMVPWSRLKSDPIVFTIDQIAVSIVEPTEVKPAPRIWSQFQEKNRKGKPEEKRDRRDLLSTLKVVVKEIRINIKTLNGSALTVDISDVVMQSTNGEWKVVPLEQAHLVDKDRKRETQFKEITARSITLQLDQGKLSHNILRDLPLRIQMTTMYSTDEKIENDLLAVSIENFLEEANFSWNQTSWKMMLNLIHGLVTCLKRPAPPAPEKKDGGAAGPENISIGLTIGGWSLELKQDGHEQGFSFFGFGLRFLVVPERHVIIPPRTEAIESSLLISVQNFTFRELVAGKDKDPRYQKLITQAALPNAAADNILTFKVTSRRSEKEQLTSLLALQLDFVLNGIQIVFDSEIWHNLKQFLELRADHAPAPASPAVEHAAAPTTSVAAAAAVAQAAAASGAKLDFAALARNSGVTVQAVNTVFILPNDKRNPKFAEKSLQLTIGKVGLTNRPDWKVVPPMGDVAKSLPFAADALSFVTDEHAGAYRFQGEVSDVAFDLVDLKNNVEQVLKPTSVKLQTRYVKVPGPAGGHPVYQLELALSWGQMDLRLTRAQYQYFHDVGQHYTDKIKAIIVSETKDKPPAPAPDPAVAEAAAKENAAEIEKLKSQASDYLHKVVENPQSDDTAVVSALVAKSKDDKLGAVQYGLQVFRVAILLRAEGGSFDLPLKAFGVPPEKISDELTSLKFTDLQLLFENSGNTQGVMLRMGGVGAENLDHDRLPVALSVTPTGGNAHPALYDKASNYAFHLYFVHQSNLAKKDDAAKHAPPTKALPAPPPGKGPAPAAKPAAAAAAVGAPSSEIGFRIGGVRVKVKRRPRDPNAPADPAAADKPSKPLAEELNALVPTLKEMATGLMAKFTAHSADVDKGVDYAKKSYDYLDIHWAVELGDAEFQLLEGDGQSRGQFRVGSSSKEKISKAFTTLEDELVACKMALAQADQDREALANALADAKMEVSKAKEQAKKDQGMLEQILIDTKLKLAEAESELMSSRAPKGATPGPARKK